MDPLVETLRQQIIAALNLTDTTPDQIDPAAALFGAGLGLDSIDALELAVMIEKHYNIKITDITEGRQALASVKSMAEFIRRNQVK